ncbi:phage major capsid protein [Lactobacillus isalae]|uniref:phage major capsid protein n=1 Tax=Lactobacillus isalae TaxID=2993455 RepID=UPI0024A9E0AF|nr:phage major capsid protein [Lactobacillus isalae]
MLKEKIKEATAKYNDLVQKRSALLKDADTASEVKDIKEIRSKITGLNTELDQAKADLDDLKELEKEEQRSIAPEVNEGPHHRGGGSSKDKLEIQKRAINAYIHTRDASNATEVGLKSEDAEVTIPKDIQYIPTEEVKTVTDLSKLVTQFTPTTASGTYPIVKRATAKLHTVAELEKNPELAKPEFIKREWKVDTYRGAIPLSQESIEDSAADLIGIVSNNAMEQKINTTNAAISTILQSFTAKSVSGSDVDAIKHILNVDLDPAYQRTIIASQSFYQYLDTLKDKNGRYLLNDPITTDSPAMLLGVSVIVVEDNLLGKDGEAHAFIGDIKRAVLYANRSDIQIRWVDNDIYGTYLRASVRFGVVKADENAGYFVTAGTAGN